MNNYFLLKYECIGNVLLIEKHNNMYIFYGIRNNFIILESYEVKKIYLGEIYEYTELD